MKAISTTTILAALSTMGVVEAYVCKASVATTYSPDCLRQYGSCVDNRRAPETHAWYDFDKKNTFDFTLADCSYYSYQDFDKCRQDYKMNIHRISTERTQWPVIRLPSQFDHLCDNKPDGVYPHPDNCRMFIECIGGYGLEESCPTGLLFNPDTIVCDDPRNVDCGGMAQQSNIHDASGVPQDWCTSKPDGNYPHPDSCSKFIACSGGVQWIFDCPENLNYNPITNACDYPDNVNCDPGQDQVHPIFQ